MSYQYAACCSDIPWSLVMREGGLLDMQDQALEITRRTFLRNVGRKEVTWFERELKYADHPARGLTMAADSHVRYYRGKLFGQRVYFINHSSIEFIFTPGGILPRGQVWRN